MSDLLAQSITIPGLTACPAWCAQHEANPAAAGGAAHQSRTAQVPADDGLPVDVGLSLYQFDPEPVAGNAGEPTVCLTIDDTGAQLTLVQAMVLRAKLDTLIRVALDELELAGRDRAEIAALPPGAPMTGAEHRAWYAAQLANLGTALRAKSPAESDEADEFACCDVDPNCAHAQETAANIAKIRAEAEAQ